MYNLPDLNKLYLLFEERVKEKYGNKNIVLDVRCFIETFPNSAAIFYNGGMAGQAMTGCFVSVFFDLNNDFVVVYGDESIAYEIEKPNDKFFEDLKDLALEPAIRKYIYRNK